MRRAERLERGLLEGLAQRRMGVDRAGDILEPRAHLDGERRSAADSSETPLPTAWMPSTRCVVGARDDAHEAVLVGHGQRAAIGGEGEAGRS